MIDLQTAFQLKNVLLCKGVYLDPDLANHYRTQGIDIGIGRKGGAGPLGGRYFLLEDNKTLVNVVLWDDRKKTNIILKENIDGFFEIYDDSENGTIGKMKLVKPPTFYSNTTSDGIQMSKIALVHGIDCLATTIYQKCKYWACGKPCSFCGIELSLKNGTTIEEKTHQQISEVITAAKEENRCSHMTLTSGTRDTDDKGAVKYIELLAGLKAAHPDIPLHIQIEPMDDLNYISKLKDAGADTIGIHIEILDEFLRGIITPGKAKIPYQKFVESWKYALEVFGKNQVETFLLPGFGESSVDFNNDIEKIIALGVIPFITPIRSNPGIKDLPITNHNVMLGIYKNAVTLMKQYGVNPLEHKAGCVRCGGCSALIEAYNAF